MEVDTPADSEKTRSWKEVLDEKLLRLHSLQFGAELALDNGDAETALSLSLCLLGFLESECRTPTDSTYITPIIDSTKRRLNAAREQIAPTLDRCVLEQANCEEKCIFKKTNSVDLAKIKRSKFFLPYFVNDLKPVAEKKTITAQRIRESVSGKESISGDITVQGECSNAPKTSTDKVLKSQHSDENSTKTNKNLTQSKLTIVYGNGNTKPSVAVSKPNAITSQKHITQDHLSSIRAPQQQGSGNRSSSPTYLDDDDERHYGAAAKRRKPTPPEEASGYGHKKVDTFIEPDGNLQEAKPGGFVTAKQKWTMDSIQKKSSGSVQCQQNSSSAYTGPTSSSYHVNNNGYRSAVPKSLGMSRRGVRSNFIPPVRSNGAAGGSGCAGYATTPPSSGGQNNGLDESTRKCIESLLGPDGELPDKLKNVEPRLIEHISNEIMDQDPNVRWDDIAGLEHAKKCVTEMVIWPLLRPDIFQGCRSPGKGLLLFGPPGTGKTMIGKAIAGEAKATFFSISASSLTSKWIGEGEKLVRALFGVASCRQPAVIFIDEVDSLLSQRKSDGEHESSRRLKTQFLIEMEGCGSGNDQLLLIGATNRPQELDEAARRRLSKRLYIPLPSAEARAWIVQNLLKKDGLFTLSDDDIREICNRTEGYSGSDMSNLVKEASMGPLREALMRGIDINKLRKEEMRPVMLKDFENAVQHVKPSVSQNELGLYEDWNRQFGSHSL